MVTTDALWNPLVQILIFKIQMSYSACLCWKNDFLILYICSVPSCFQILTVLGGTNYATGKYSSFLRQFMLPETNKR